MTDGQSKFEVLLVKSGPNKIEMMKVVMALTGWGLKQSKDLIDDPPGLVIEGVSYEKALQAINTLESAGAEAEMQRVVELD
jgi:large subunit ribosomal protein L7/L12